MCCWCLLHQSLPLNSVLLWNLPTHPPTHFTILLTNSTAMTLNCFVCPDKRQRMAYFMISFLTDLNGHLFYQVFSCKYWEKALLVTHSCSWSWSSFLYALKCSELPKPIVQHQERCQQTVFCLSQALVNGELLPSSFFALKTKGKATKLLGESLVGISYEWYKGLNWITTWTFLLFTRTLSDDSRWS